MTRAFGEAVGFGPDRVLQLSTLKDRHKMAKFVRN